MNVSIRLIRIFYHTFIHQKNVLEYVKELILVSNISSRRKVESFKKNVSRNAIKREVLSKYIYRFRFRLRNIG